MKATERFGQLKELPSCDIIIPGAEKIQLYVLPEMSDRKGLNYEDLPVVGRALPITTFSHGENRTVTMKIHLLTLNEEGPNSIKDNMRILRTLQSMAYPRNGDAGRPYLPPPLAQIRVGSRLTSQSGGYVCAMLREVNVTYPTDVAVDPVTMLPYKFEIDLTWQIVFPSNQLPGHETIMKDL